MVTRNCVCGATRCMLIVAVSMALSIPVASVKATAINVGDYSFENQVVPANPGYASPPDESPDQFPNTWLAFNDGTTGSSLIYNPSEGGDSWSNVTGSQTGLAYYHDSSSKPGLFEVLTTDVQAGQAYEMKVDLARNAKQYRRERRLHDDQRAVLEGSHQRRQRGHGDHQHPDWRDKHFVNDGVYGEHRRHCSQRSGRRPSSRNLPGRRPEE